jgi:hypothetical protein
MKLTLQNGKLVSQDGIEVENANEFIYKDYKSNYWFRNFVNKEPIKEGEEIALPESIGWEKVSMVKNKFGHWRPCTETEYEFFSGYEKRQVIRLKPVEKRKKSNEKVGDEILKDFVDAEEHNTQEHEHIFEGEIIEGAERCQICGDANTDTQESQVDLWKEVIQLVDYNDYKRWEYVSQILSEKFILTRKA